MGQWEEALKGLNDAGTFSHVSENTPDVAPSWESAASEMQTRGQVPSTPSTWDDALKNFPAFMEKAPVTEGGMFRGAGATGSQEEDDSGMFERGWDTIKRISSAMPEAQGVMFSGKRVREGLGLLWWPLERIEYSMATPLMGVAKEKPVRKLFTKDEGSAKQASDKVVSDTVEALKAWIPGREVPEQAKTFDDLYANYYTDLTGEPAPPWYSWVMGGITSFVTTPAIQSKILKVAGKPIVKPLRELAETRNPQWWRRAKLSQKAEINSRLDTVKDVDTLLSKKDLGVIATELSEKTGTVISPEVVQKRLAQIIKGGITEQPELARRANAVISEFQFNLSELRKLNVKGFADKFVYTQKLSNAQLAQLKNRKLDLQRQLNKLVPGAVRYSDEQKQILTMGKNAPVNVWRGKDTGKLHLLEQNTTKMVNTADGGTAVVDKATNELLGFETELSAFAGDVRAGKVLVAPYQKRLVALADKLKVSGKASIENDLLVLAQQVEAGDLQYVDRLGKLLNINKKTLGQLSQKLAVNLEKAGAGVSGVSEKALKIRQTEGHKLINDILKIAGKEEGDKIVGLRPLIHKLISTPKGTTAREYATRESLLKLADKLKIGGKEKIVDDLLKLGDAIDAGDLKYIREFSKILNIEEAKLITLVEKSAESFLKAEETIGRSVEPILRLREREGQRIVNELLDIGTKTEKQTVMGLKPLLNKLFAMKYRFPGRSKVIDTLTSQIQEINNTLYTSEIFGGTEYFPRMYAAKEAEAAPGVVAAIRRGIKGIRAPYAKERKVLSAEVRKKMGEITTAEYPVVKRLIQQAADIETAKLFNGVATNPQYSSRVANGFFKQLPESDKYGNLSGMFVHPRIHADITEITRIKGSAEQIYDEAISLWKLGKVTWSPGAHFRNKFGNSVLKSLSGMSEQEKVTYGVKAWKHFQGKTDEYKTATKFLKQSTFVGEELLHSVFKDAAIAKQGSSFLGRSYGKFRKLVEAPSKGYQALEFHDKFTLYLKARDKGKSVIEAVEHANKWLFDYSDLASWEKNIMRRIMPFYTFPRKALPRVFEAAVNNPYALYKYPLMAKVATQYSLYKLNFTEKDYQDMQKVLPEYMKRGSYILLPYRDDNGDLRFFDWTYIIPWGEMTEVTDRGVTNILVSNPLYVLVSDINHNQSSFTGRQIWKDTDTTEEKAWKSTEYVWQGLVPSLSYKGIYWDKLYRAATGETKYGKKEMIPEGVAHTIFGLRTQALDLNIAQRKHVYEQQAQLRELQNKMRDLLVRQTYGEVTPEESYQLRQQYLNQMMDVVK